MNKNDTIYARLYVDKVTNFSELADMVKNEFMNESSIEVDITSSDIFDDAKKNQSDGFVYYEHNVEIEFPDLSNAETMRLKMKVCNLIKRMRSVGYRVVASCDYEDLVISATGWNWSDNDVTHP